MCDGKTRNAYFLWRNVIFNTSLLFEKKLLCFNARISNKAICSFVLVNVCLNSTFHPLCKTYQSKCKILGVTFANYRIQIEHVRCLILVQIKYATCYVTGKISSDVETTGCLEKKRQRMHSLFKIPEFESERNGTKFLRSVAGLQVDFPVNSQENGTSMLPRVPNVLERSVFRCLF